jgi:hypothetical protein
MGYKREMFHFVSPISGIYLHKIINMWNGK